MNMFTFCLAQLDSMMLLLLVVRWCHDAVFVGAEEAAVSEYLSSTDLTAFGTNVEAIRCVFEQHFGQKPGHLSLNDEVYYGHFAPPTADKKHHYCFKKISIPVIKYRTPTETTVIVGTQIFNNDGPNMVHRGAVFACSFSENTTHMTTNTLGVHFDQNLRFKGVFSEGSSFSISTSVQEEKTETSIREFIESRYFYVPPYSSVNVSLVATVQTQLVYYKSNIWVDGWFGGSQRDKKFHWFRGHHHVWHFLREASVLPRIQGLLIGKMKHVKVIEVAWEINPLESPDVAFIDHEGIT